MTRVFVYGTLKRGGGNHGYLAGQRFLGEACTLPGYTLFSLGDFPGMVRSTGQDHQVIGELWAVDRTCLATLDELEGLAEGLYERVSIGLAAPFADSPAESYLYLRSLEGHRALGSLWPE